MPVHFLLHGLRLRVDSDEPPVQDLLRCILRYKGAEALTANDSVDLTLELNVGQSLQSLPESARHVGTSKQCEIDVWDAPERMLLCHEEATVAVHPEGRRAEGVIRPSLLDARPQQRRDPLFHLVVLGLGLVLRHRGWFPLHAAALVRDECGVLLPARSGQGKTTIALSLLRNGWAALSDDTVLLRAADDQVMAHAFRRPFCVGSEAAEHFSELRAPDWPASLSDSSKWQVEVDRLYPGQSVSTCTPRLLVVPTIVDAPESRVEPIGPKPALEQILLQSAFFLSSRPEVADRHLTVLRRLVGQTDTYRLHAGRDVLETPRTMHTLLTPLLADWRSSAASE